MRRENMERMTLEELDEYGKVVGVSVGHASSAEDKVRLIERAREKSATMRALGMEMSIPYKALHDKRASDLLAKPNRTDEETDEVLSLILGEEQKAELYAACTDEDGTVDVDALALAYVKIFTSDELKNF